MSDVIVSYKGFDKDLGCSNRRIQWCSYQQRQCHRR